MPSSLPDWPRPRYENPGGRPFLFHVVHGRFPEVPAVGTRKYRSLGIPPGLTLSLYGRDRYPDVFAGFEEGYPWDDFRARNPSLAGKVSRSDQCLVLQGELEDRGDLNYLRDSVGLLTCLLDHGGVSVYDPQILRWWEPAAWRRDVFEANGPVPQQHVVILVSDEGGEAATAAAEPLTWFHTRGLRKFGRPDLSVHNIPRDHHDGTLDLIGRFIELQALGGIIPEGQTIRMRSMPSGMVCRHAGDLDDPDFNNVHVEITPPS